MVTIGSLATRSVVDTDIHETLQAVAEQLASNDVGALLVYSSGVPAGIISERDLVRAVADGVPLELTRVRDYMTEAPVQIQASDSLQEAIVRMSDLGVRHLAVTSNAEIVGMISARDILKALRGKGLSTSAVSG